MNKFLNRMADYIRECDKSLYILCIFSALYGCIAILSAGSRSQFVTQIVALILGVVAMFFMSKLDYKLLAKYWYLTAGVTLIPVILTFFIGFSPSGTDDKAWLILPGNISFQPSELLKIGFAITFAFHISRLGENINKIKNLVLLCMHGAFPVLLIHFQGDDGTAMVFAIMFICMMYSAGVKGRYFIVAIIGALISLPLIFFFIMNDAQRNRIITLFNPEADLLGAGWQQWKGRIALANGGFFGQGLFKGELTQSGSIPEGYNDFIIASVGEELGILGCLAVIILLTAIALRILKNGRRSRDKLGEIMCVGIFGMIAAQLIINIGMCVSLLPVIGVTLPFFSAGGTSLACLFLGMGLVMSIYMHRRDMTIYLHDTLY